MTSSFITKDARATLYRAFNLRRLIAMTGSGATDAFGFPHWQDLALLFAEETDRQIQQSLTSGPLPLSSGERKVEKDRLYRTLRPLIDATVPWSRDSTVSSKWRTSCASGRHNAGGSESR